jgi:hypothetical protein
LSIAGFLYSRSRCDDHGARRDSVLPSMATTSGSVSQVNRVARAAMISTELLRLGLCAREDWKDR